MKPTKILCLRDFLTSEEFINSFAWQITDFDKRIDEINYPRELVS